MNRLALAIDVGGSKLEAAVADSSGRIIAGTRARRPTGSSISEADLSTGLADLIEHSLERVPAGEVICGVGIGSAGPLDAETVSPVNLPAWRKFPIADVVRELVARRAPPPMVRLRLDGQCFSLAESRYGAGRLSQSMLGVVVSTGIGGGFVIDDNLWHGASGNAGHIGQMECPFTCEETDASTTLDAVASGPATLEWARAHGWEGADGRDLARSYARGDAVAKTAIERSARLVGRALASVLTLTDVDLVVVGGGFANVTERYVGMVSDWRVRYASHDYVRRTRIVASKLGHEAPLIGAACLVF